MSTADGAAAAPLLLLDVDGVVNVVTRAGDPTVWSDWQTGTAYNELGGWPILWSPTVIDHLRRWHTAGLCEIRWLTTWLHEAPRDLSRLLELPPYAVMAGRPLSDTAPSPKGALSHGEATGRAARDALTGKWWKADLVFEQLRAEPTRPVLWIDDELRFDKNLRAHLMATADCLLIGPQRFHGLTPQDLLKAEQWLRSRASRPAADEPTEAPPNPTGEPA